MVNEGVQTHIRFDSILSVNKFGKHKVVLMPFKAEMS